MHKTEITLELVHEPDSYEIHQRSLDPRVRWQSVTNSERDGPQISGMACKVHESREWTEREQIRHPWNTRVPTHACRSSCPPVYRQRVLFVYMLIRISGFLKLFFFLYSHVLSHQIICEVVSKESKRWWEKSDRMKIFVKLNSRK